MHLKVHDHIPLALLAKEVLELLVRRVVHTGGDGEERLRGVVGAVGTGLHPSPYHRVEEVATPPYVAARMGDKLRAECAFVPLELRLVHISASVDATIPRVPNGEDEWRTSEGTRDRRK